VIDAHGRVTAKCVGDGPEVVTAELERSTAATPYQALGDAGVAAGCLVLFALGRVGRAPPAGLYGG
jgi:hypothetical protein